jgi:hypothetical protein
MISHQSNQKNSQADFKGVPISQVQPLCLQSIEPKIALEHRKETLNVTAFAFVTLKLSDPFTRDHELFASLAGIEDHFGHSMQDGRNESQDSLGKVSGAPAGQTGDVSAT